MLPAWEGGQGVKEEALEPLRSYQGFQPSSSSWDSGVVLDTSTALQMAEFQEVVDKLAMGGPPPPYPGPPSVVVTRPPTPQHLQRELKEVLVPWGAQPRLVHSFNPQTGARVEVSGSHSLPALGAAGQASLPSLRWD